MLLTLFRTVYFPTAPSYNDLGAAYFEWKIWYEYASFNEWTDYKSDSCDDDIFDIQ